MRFTIGRLMILVAVAAGLGAWLRVPGAGALTAAAVLILVPATIALFSPCWFARPGGRLLFGSWIASLWPLSILWALHAAWIIALAYLGHPPGPADNGPVIEILTGSVLAAFLLSGLSSLACLLLQQLVDGEGPIVFGFHRDIRAIPILLIPLIWIVVVVVLQWDPVGAYFWLLD